VKTYPVNYNWRSEYQIPVDCKVLTLVAGIRPVKDPLYLLHCFSGAIFLINRVSLFSIIYASVRNKLQYLL